MHWKILTPFSYTEHPGWIPEHIPHHKHTFEVVTTDYVHDRSRKNASVREWSDYLRHVLRGWLPEFRSRQKIGFLTAFPQLPVVLGLLKRLSRSRAPVLAWCFNMGRTYGGLKGRIAKFALRSVDLFVVHSSHEIETYSKWLGISPKRFVFVPLSVEVKEPVYEEDMESPFLLAMGTANRDYRTLIAAVEQLGYPTVIVTGAHAIEGLTVRGNVQIRTGLTIDQCHELCQKARVNVIPVYNEDTASGQVSMLEAMMFRKTVVATRCPGTVDYIENGVTGLLVPPCDVAALADAIEAAWTDARLRQRIGATARAYVDANITFGSVASSMERLLSRLEAGPPT